MIRYALMCDRQHVFESWFRDSATCDDQLAGGTVECPVCNSTRIDKQMMAPSLRTGRAAAKQRVAAAGDERQKQLLEMVRKLRRQVEANAEYVGERFPEEARRMHYQEAASRGIYGEASLEEVKELAEEGIETQALPRLPEDAN